MNKILALDIGTKRIGIAVSDGLGMLAHPLKTIKWSGIQQLSLDLTNLLEENSIETIVCGIPYTMKGEYSKKTLNFCISEIFALCIFLR